jgi:30S ribosomal protein 3
MLSPMATQPGTTTVFCCSSFSYQMPSFRPFKTLPFVMPKAFFLHSYTILDPKNKPIRRNQKVTFSAAPETLTAENESLTSTTSEELNPSQEIEVQFSPSLSTRAYACKRVFVV